MRCVTVDAQAREEEQAAVFLCHIATCKPKSDKSIIEYFGFNGDPAQGYLSPFVNMRFITFAGIVAFSTHCVIARYELVRV